MKPNILLLLIKGGGGMYSGVTTQWVISNNTAPLSTFKRPIDL